MVEIEEAEVLRLGDLRIDAVEVAHQPVPIAFGFIFTTKERKVALSGDTTYCPPLIQAAKHAD